MTCSSKQELTKQKSLTVSETALNKFLHFERLGETYWKKQNISQLGPSIKCTTLLAKKEYRSKAFLLIKGFFAIPVQTFQEKPFSPSCLPSQSILTQAKKPHDLDLSSNVSILKLLKLEEKISFKQGILEMETLWQLWRI